MRQFAVAILLLGGASVLPAEWIQIGVKGGAILTEPTALASDESKRYTVGPSVEVKLPGRTKTPEFPIRL